MPGYKGHIGFSVAIWMLFYALAAIFSFSIGVFLEPETVVGAFISVVLFGLWPDVDTNSIGQDIFYPLFLFIAITLLILDRPFESALVGIFSMLPTVGKHRGWTHTWWAAVTIPTLFLIIVPSLISREMDFRLWPYAVSGIAGYFGHLIIDGELSPKKLLGK